MRTKRTLSCGYEYEIGSAPLMGDKADRALEILRDDNGGLFERTRDLFVALIDAGCTDEVAAEVKEKASFDDTKNLDELLVIVLGGGSPDEEVDETIPKNSDTPSAGSDG